MNLFDICLITASNEKQASIFRKLIRRRVENGLYPGEIDFRVYSDPENGRVGSGGGTLLALRALVEDFGVDAKVAEPFLRGKRILMIHAGGESRRLPCYSPEGKLFAPIPVAGSSPLAPVVLDLQLSLFLRFPWREGELVIASGDVVIDFDTDSIGEDRGDVCGFAYPAPPEQGARHGVFKFDRNRQTVIGFHQKETPQYLREHALLEGMGECALDTGIVSFSPSAASRLLTFSEQIGRHNRSIAETLHSGDLKLDLYLEILTACLSGIELDEFITKVHSRSNVDPEILGAVYETFSDIDLRGVVARRTSFLHFGSLGEYPESSFELTRRDTQPFYTPDNAELRPWIDDDTIRLNCRNMSIERARGPIFCEACENVRIFEAGGANLFIGLRDVDLSYPVPYGICIDQRDIEGGSMILVYSIHDTWKRQRDMNSVVVCGIPVEQWLTQRGLGLGELWEDPECRDLTLARLYSWNFSPLFLRGFWDPDYAGGEWRDTFRAASRITAAEVNARSRAVDRDSRRAEIRSRRLRESILDGNGWVSVSETDFADLFEKESIPESLHSRMNQTNDDLLHAYRHRSLSVASGEYNEEETRLSFQITYSARDDAARLRRGVKEDQIVWARSPVRFDLAGGWSDTPPYTLRSGGQVTNLAVNLNGQPPIQVFCRPTTEPRITIHSIDLGFSETVTEFAQLLDYRNPTSPFALPKAALCLLGLTPETSGSADLAGTLSGVGCGLEITLLCAVPKGSGLGTSSILGATILGALHRFFGLRHAEDELFRQVLQMEQMLTTGGGWQDQIGGVVGGVKYIECRAGLKPVPVVHRLDPYLFSASEHRRCFTLFYTGVTRLAKNILQDVVHGFNGLRPSYLFTIDHVRQLALDARRAVSLRDMHRLAGVLNGSWDANKRIHPGTTTDAVEHILRETAGLYVGMKLLGAGGGGYALFLSEDVSRADALRERLDAHCEGGNARIVDFEVNHDGLQISVS